MNYVRNSAIEAQPEKIVFIVTSVIQPSLKPLSYSAVRSVFSTCERSVQTLKTVESIRTFYKYAYIILVEMGSTEMITTELKSAVDKVIFVGNNTMVRLACDGKHKGLGEAVGLIAAKKSIKNLGHFYFKISGRYFLTGNFDPKLWGGDSFIARKYGDAMSTRLYGFSKDLFSAWEYALWRGVPWLLAGKQIENVLPRFLPTGCVRHIDRLGVAGAVSPNGEFLEE